ncbi:MAG: amidohydrolase family protein [Croceibacterium sp.]
MISAMVSPSIVGAKTLSHSRIRAIDTHAHIFLRDLPMAQGRRYAPDYDAPPAQYLGHLAANGIDRGVLVQPSFLGTDNSYLLGALQSHGDILRGIAVVDPDVSPASLIALHQSKIRGVRLNLIGQPTPDLSTPVWRAHLRHLADLNWLVEVQIEAARLQAIAPSILAGGPRLVIDHFGRPDTQLGIQDPGFRYLLGLGKTRRTWVKMSGAYRLSGPDSQSGGILATNAAKALIGSLGVDRLMWGSDWPHTQFEKVATYPSARAALDLWVPNQKQREAVLVQTPRALFGF